MKFPQSSLALVCWAALLSSTFLESVSASVSSSKAKLPASLFSVAQDCSSSNNEQEEGSTAAACLLTSRTVTQAAQTHAFKTLLNLQENEDESVITASQIKAVGTSNDETNTKTHLLALTSSASLAELAASLMATGGNVAFVVSETDLARGEGLWESLAPAMQLILANALTSTAQLTIVVTSDNQVALAKQHILEPSEAILANLITASQSQQQQQQQPVTALSQVFGKGVHIQTLDQAALTVFGSETDLITDSAALQQAAAGLPTSSSVSSTTALSPTEMASAGLFAKAQAILQDAIETVQQATRASDGSVQLVPAFNKLCASAMQTAAQQLQQEASGLSSPLVSQLQQQTLTDLSLRLESMMEVQLDLQKKASLADFKQGLSKLLIGPNLASDMQGVAQKVAASFAQAAKAMASPALSGPAVIQFQQIVHEQTRNRLLNARASGKFKPLPRKGVTVGLHWLLPKPFGNDYRQEPWKVHATDNLVYVPPGKVSHVDPQDVPTGDWRQKVVPSPVGNDLVYMQ